MSVKDQTEDVYVWMTIDAETKAVMLWRMPDEVSALDMEKKHGPGTMLFVLPYL